MLNRVIIIMKLADKIRDISTRWIGEGFGEYYLLHQQASRLGLEAFSRMYALQYQGTVPSSEENEDFAAIFYALRLLQLRVFGVGVDVVFNCDWEYGVTDVMFAA